MIELLDKRFFSYLKDFIGRARLVVTADHTTSCRQKAHTAAPVPVMTYPQEKESRRRFIESDAAKGKKIMGRNLLKNYFFEK
jgi:2,3-bisphosphoglycerate-independent phosphoglycerate mutase